MERSPSEVGTRRNKNLATQDLAWSFQHEVAQLFDRFKHDLEALFAVRTPVIGGQQRVNTQQPLRKKTAA